MLLTARPLLGLAAAGGPASHLLAASQADPSPLWYATRATGVVALVLLTITVALGVAGVSRLSSPRWPRVITSGLHKNISLLVVAFVVVHVLTTVLDSFVSISPAAAVVPFISNYRPFWLSLGTIAFDLILALVVTSLLRTRISYRAWRAVHWLAYASWPIALWHGLGTGTDARVPWLLALDALCLLLVGGALLWRLTQLTPGPGRTAAMATTVAVPVATIVFALIGPLRPGWAERAGAPITSAIEMSSGSARLAPPADGSAWDGQVPTLSGPRLPATLPGHAGATVQAQLTLMINGSQASSRGRVRPAEAR